ncbi:MAG TPA: sulfatase-like hydrolase/transferase, partial [Thermoanaerobaculia bacterium]|nr:sulfatase-like hydrolase/transferase [Thermoanaerobaculia bacterium]
MKRLIFVLAFLTAASLYAAPRNIVFILSDDHRYDFMGFHPNAPEFLETPALDRLAAEGAHVENAFVTTSLCSPSRASILTGH